MTDVIRAGAWSGFRELVRDLGGNPDEILTAARVDIPALNHPERYLPLSSFLASQELAAARLNRPDFGLMMGARDTLNSLGALSIAILNSRTARDAIETASRYIHIQNPALSITLSPAPRTRNEFMAYDMKVRTSAVQSQNSERQLASAHTTLTQIAGETYRPRAVWFTHKPLSPLIVYRRLFGVTPLFERQATGIAIESKVLDQFLPGHSPELRRVAESFLKALGRPRDVNLSHRVAGLIASLLQSGDCTPISVARAMGMHERTLQRRLKLEGVTFEQIKDDIRRDQAESMLAQADIPISHIALTLDYADASAFTRSCRRWFGVAPSTLRGRLLARTRRSQKEPETNDRMHPLVVAQRLSRRSTQT